MTTLRNLREKYGFTRKYVANFLNITGDYLNEIERGQGSINLKRAEKLAYLYKTDIEKIFEIWGESNEVR